MAEHDISGKKVAFLLTDGVEQVELTSPWEAVKAAGGEPTLVSLSSGTIQGFDGIDKGETFTVDLTVADADAADYDALVLPGGVVNADYLRVDKDAQDFARAFFEAHKPVASICHAPWLLIEAGVVRGRDMTSYPSLATDLKNAGANWSDEEVVVDQGLVTSRNPGDLPAFNDKLVEEIAEGEHEGQHA
ncbi:type 1 glutamine amidotransferase domain-containing protein [Arthrobacter sp. zg-Y820]|uniref:type 1 glutamine amidotransferase domain-containing protein n=1 Tax=unclassified Arthrobacter TaxID=235627 RepID=UPI001E5C3E70|nr:MULTISPECIES: type 1 glutamine amidotransferase domain-containing protein [unclassified Arthrobacter]MCC9195742.1 type 1 glutamine amidotransferase [Arthrobacter sp. zg-Y820]MDK1278601.1 type 1 glutamine amidotransferase domain-containing protein [Arthrobacter sp. zg.Y820]MDK1359801.1 type 1 glutamine amidotransferase domain-containing protein [Arthrobacter sp. zg-Y1219]WIB08966.1 type 1 glutamine amidotransferase domain-containing protein [Arthrobacter sp. zg-Y820]